jgi:hypothetical protein
MSICFKFIHVKQNTNEEVNTEDGSSIFRRNIRNFLLYSTALHCINTVLMALDQLL